MTMASVDPVVTPSGEASSQSNKLATGEVPSGFILKLFQMVNGAPDEVISVSSLGVYMPFPPQSIVVGFSDHGYFGVAM